MKLVILSVLAVVALATAAPQRADKDAQIIKNDFDQQPDGPYSSSFETDNGIKKQEQGELKQVPDEDNKPVEALVVRGAYSYVDTEGKQHNVNYFADETGFHAESEDIPRN